MSLIFKQINGLHNSACEQSAVVNTQETKSLSY